MVVRTLALAALLAAASAPVRAETLAFGAGDPGSPWWRIAEAVPSPHVSEMVAGGGALVLPLPRAALDALSSANPGTRVVAIPARSTPGQDSEAASFVATTHFMVAANLDEETVREIVLALLDGRARLGAASGTLAGITSRRLATGVGVADHPGAEAAYRERGLLH